MPQTDKKRLRKPDRAQPQATATRSARPSRIGSSLHYDHVEPWVTRILLGFKNKLYDHQQWLSNFSHVHSA